MASPDGSETLPDLLGSVPLGCDSAAPGLLPSPKSDHAKPCAGNDAQGGGHGPNPHFGNSGRPKKGGAGGKGTWGLLLNNGGELHIDRRDPNYDSEEEPYKLVSTPVAQSLEVYKQKVVQIIEKYFLTGNVAETAAELRQLGSSNYHHYFVKKLISMSMDRLDCVKEMASVLLSALYADVIHPEQVSKGFLRLVESVDDLVLDIPEAVDILALFIARAVVDDIIPTAFLTKTSQILPEGSKGHQVIHVVEKSYLSGPLHVEIVERRWGGSTHSTVEEMKKKITALLDEYVGCGNKAEACRCIRELNVPFFHHEVVKRALIIAMEKRNAEDLILSLLKEAAEEGLITSSQMSKGFARLSDSIDDLSLDIPCAKEMSLDLISKAIDECWIASTAAIILSSQQNKDLSGTGFNNADKVAAFKKKSTTIIQEYFLSDDIAEVVRSLEDLGSPDLNPIFVKRLITLAMDRKHKEKEMASVLLSALYAELLTVNDIIKAFVLLLESAEDTALDIPNATNELAMFLARAVVDDVLAPLDLYKINDQLSIGSLGSETVHTSSKVLRARYAGERILRCWGGGTGWAVEDAKDKIIRLLEEYEAGGDVAEACQCIRDIDMPFFHHEVVKKALVMAMEKKNDRMLNLLQQASAEGLVTTNQMAKGFIRVVDSLDDLALDIPNAREKLAEYVKQAGSQGWLKSMPCVNLVGCSSIADGDAAFGN